MLKEKPDGQCDFVPNEVAAWNELHAKKRRARCNNQKELSDRRWHQSHEILVMPKVGKPASWPAFDQGYCDLELNFEYSGTEKHPGSVSIM